MTITRKITNQLIEVMDSGELDARIVANAALDFLSEHDVSIMVDINELLNVEEEWPDIEPD